MTEATFYSLSCTEQTLKAMMPTNALPLWKTLLAVVVIKRVNTVVILLFWYSLSESPINISQVMQHCLCHVEAFWFLTYLVVYKVIFILFCLSGENMWRVCILWFNFIWHRIMYRRHSSVYWINWVSWAEWIGCWRRSRYNNYSVIVRDFP